MKHPPQTFAVTMSPLEIGKLGEHLAAEYLKQHGYRIVATNFTAPIGYSHNGRPITGEIDIVAYDETASPFTLVFIEVKTRTRTDIAAPEAAVDRRKQRHITRAARLYRHVMKVENEPSRYDVVGIILESNKTPEVTLRRGYFTEKRFAMSQRP